MNEDNPDWHDDDVPVGRGLYLLTVVILLSATVGIAWTGYNHMALIGWPVLGGLAFVLLRVWKRMLRDTVDDVVETVDLKGNIFDDTPVSSVSEKRERDIDSASKSGSNWVAIGLGLFVYAIFITLFWYGIGRGVHWIVGFF